MEKRGKRFHDEDELTAYLKQKLISNSGILGIGDDAAVIPQFAGSSLLTTDTLLEDIHFKTQWITPFYLGQKAALSNVSDIAAMGGKPHYVLVSLQLPKPNCTYIFINELYEGMMKVFSPLHVQIVGGNITRSQKLGITLTIVGAVTKPLQRTGAQADDLICVTGYLGHQAYELEKLKAGKINKSEYLSPCRVVFGQKLSSMQIATSCIDISDGLLRDLGRLITASRVSATVYTTQIPCIDTLTAHDTHKLQMALHGGEEYELLFTVKPTKIEKLFEMSSETSTPIAVIGKISNGKQVIKVLDEMYRQMPVKLFGWDHLNDSVS